MLAETGVPNNSLSACAVRCFEYGGAGDAQALGELVDGVLHARFHAPVVDGRPHRRDRLFHPSSRERGERFEFERFVCHPITVTTRGCS